MFLKIRLHLKVKVFILPTRALLKRETWRKKLEIPCTDY